MLDEANDNSPSRNARARGAFARSVGIGAGPRGAASGRPDVKRIASRPGTGTDCTSMLVASGWASVNCTGVAPGVASVIHNRPSFEKTARLFDSQPPK